MSRGRGRPALEALEAIYVHVWFLVEVMRDAFSDRSIRNASDWVAKLLSNTQGFRNIRGDRIRKLHRKARDELRAIHPGEAYDHYVDHVLRDVRERREQTGDDCATAVKGLIGDIVAGAARHHHDRAIEAEIEAAKTRLRELKIKLLGADANLAAAEVERDEVLKQLRELRGDGG